MRCVPPVPPGGTPAPFSPPRWLWSAARWAGCLRWQGSRGWCGCDWCDAAAGL